jgi:N4-(beta-N-acetylglucosaminyl)-L-asparaginase
MGVNVINILDKSTIILGSDLSQFAMQIIASSFSDKGKSLVNSVEDGIRAVEDNISIPWVGEGGAPDMLGKLTLDGGIMTGDGRMGAVAQTSCRHPFRLAKRIYEGRYKHTFLVGDGADRFAREIGEEFLPLVLPEHVQEGYDSWVASNVPNELQQDWPNNIPADYPLSDLVALGTVKDTVTINALQLVNGESKFLTATSTSGGDCCYPFRTGDSPIPGAGFFAIDGIGCATVTHVGEVSMTVSTSSLVVYAMKYDRSLKDAVVDAFKEVKRIEPQRAGQIVIHAMNNKGEIYVASNQHQEGLKYYTWSSDTNQIKAYDPEIITL